MTHSSNADTEGWQLIAWGTVMVTAPLVLAATMIWVASAQYILGNASADWPTTEGVVLESTRRNGGTSLRYQWLNDGEPFSSFRVRAGGTRAEDVERFPVGSKVTVHFDPNSEDAVLEPGPPPMDVRFAFTWCAFAAAMGLAAVVGIHALRVGFEIRRTHAEVARPR